MQMKIKEVSYLHAHSCARARELKFYDLLNNVKKQFDKKWSWSFLQPQGSAKNGPKKAS